MAGFVHRDISAGNCLWSPEGNRPGGKISDLEYARRYDGLWGDDPRTSKASLSNADNIWRRRGKIDSKALIGPPFRFNFYHDLESVFWIYMYLLHHLFPMNSVPTDDESLDIITQSVRQRIYCGVGGTMLRTMVITNDATYLKIGVILQDFFPNHLHLLLVLGFVHELAESYRAVESSQPVTVGGTPQYWTLESFTDDPYKKIISRFQRILDIIDKCSKADGDVPALLLDLHSRKRTSGGEEQGRVKIPKGETSSLR
ncbi:hypothetical protein DXG01_010968 [Tephrocybe rancida]|nr:hypothetical protein DXG01_010968 [Tephrocybe rancida]